MIVAASVLASCLLGASAGGDDHHSHDPVANTSSTPMRTFDVTWMIPGGHSHDGGATQDAHGMTVELGEGKLLTANVNDVVTLKWEDKGHDLHQLSGEAALSTCDFTGAKELVAAASSGTFTLDTTEPATYYLSCMVGSHCGSQQKLIVKVEKTTGVASSVNRRAGHSALVALALWAAAMLDIV